MANVAFQGPLEQPYPVPDRLVGTGYAVYPTEPTTWSTPAAFVPDMAGWYRETARPVWKVKPRPHGGCWLGAVQEVASAAEFDWYRELSVPTRRKPQTRTGFAAFAGNPDLTGSLDFPKWYQPLERPRTPVKPRLQGWFGFGGDADSQEYGVIDWYVPVTQPPRWDRLGTRLGRPDPSRQGYTVIPVEPTQIVPTQALTGWYQDLDIPTRRPVRRVEGGTFAPIEPTQTAGLGWFVPVSLPTRKTPPRHTGFFVLTMNPDLLGVPYVEVWQPQTLPHRGDNDRLRRRPERMPAAFAPLEPTQIAVGSVDQWFRPLGEPPRPKPIQRHPSYTLVVDVTWFNLPGVTAWQQPLAEPVRTVPPHPIGSATYQPPPSLWTTGTVVTTPYYTLAADFYQAGALEGDQKQV